MTERVLIEVEAEALAAARAANIDLAEVLATALRRRLPALHPSEREQAARLWYEANKEAVDAYNKFVEQHGLFSDGVRAF